MLRKQRNVPLSTEEPPQRKASSGTVRSEGGLSHYSKSGIWHIHDSTDSLPSSHRGSMRSKHVSESSQDGSIRFPRLEDCAHFHYDFVDFGSLQVTLCEDDRENYHHNEAEQGEVTLLVRVSCNEKNWTVRRSLSHFSSLDRQLHRCIFDRKFSQLPDLQTANTDVKNSHEVEQLLQSYLKRFSELAGTMINCGSILNWLEMDNRGNRLLAVDDSGINTPAIAAAHAVKRYNAQAADEISLQVGDIVSVIDMPSSDDTIWWRGKRGFEVGFFPSACVEIIIGDKVPSSMATVMPTTGSLSSSLHAPTPTPLSTPATPRKPCDMDEETASMIRKHGKLMSFLRTFFTTRPQRNQLKQSGIVKERVFGCDLGEHLLNSGHDVPVVLKSCTEVIERYGIVDGIYRLSGITSNIQKLRVAFDEDEVPELMEATYLQDIHSISSLLKMYFRELPNPLLTYQLYDKFAEAVRDEDNKLLRIHDVVQQLPPPHYRTLEYLMKHLGRVASHAFETGMHSKNLAIVWAPNLLRSKELELGGGAAALQGVGIQAVVTECLICYCDLIFNDNVPSYDSPHLNKSQKKPRPKSLAISTPTRLLSLEEARERAFLTSLAHSQRFIDVGGGPSSLPPNYHTVIDLPGYRKKSGKTKGKKSPVSGGWKSIFSKPRAGSIKKPRKGSMQGDEKPLESLQAKALTVEDVHNWKHRLRTAKSAESLLSMATSARSSISSHSGPDNGKHREELLTPFHKRSLSSDTSTLLHPRLHTSPHVELPSPSPALLHPAVSTEPGGVCHPATRGSHRPADSTKNTNFIRGDSTRKPLHRRTPSAPNTPRLDRDQQAPSSTLSSPSKACSQPHLDSLSASPLSRSSPLTPPSDSSLGIDIDAAIKARLQQMALQSRGGLTSPKSPEKPPLGVSRRGDMEKRKMEARNGVVEFPASSPLDDKDAWAGDSKFFMSRYHDYAEIQSDDDEGVVSPTDMQDVMDKLDSKLSTAHFYLHDNQHQSEPQPKLPKLDGSRSEEEGEGEKIARVIKRHLERVPSNASSTSLPPTQVPRRKVDFIPSDPATNNGTNVNFPELAHQHPQTDASRPPLPHTHNQQSGGMSKCLSVPSDIAQSLENITGSQGELLSSMTLSELSQSINSFCAGAQDSAPRQDGRWRRSTSLDSIEAESSLGRTLRDINSQMDMAFHQKVERAIQLEEAGYSRHADSDSSSLTPLHISEDNLATTPLAGPQSPSPHQQSSPPGSKSRDPQSCFSSAGPGAQDVFPRSASDSGSVSADKCEVSMSQSYPVPGADPSHAAQHVTQPAPNTSNCHPDYPDYAIIRKRQKTCKEDRGPGFYSGQGVFEDSPHNTAPPAVPASSMQSFVLEGVCCDHSQWPQGGEGFADSVHVLPSSPRHASFAKQLRANDSLAQHKIPRSTAARLDSTTNSPRSGGGHCRADNSSLPHAPFGGELITGLCVVRRQDQSSSSSSDVDDNSDDSMELVQAAGAQFALRVSRRQKGKENLSSRSSAPASPAQSTGHTRTTVSADDITRAKDVVWKQSPLFSKGEGGSGEGEVVRLRQHKHDVVTTRESGDSAQSKTNRYGFSSETSRTFPPYFHTDTDYGSNPCGDRGGWVCDGPARRLSQSCDYSRESYCASARQRLGQGGRPRAASQSDSSVKFQREDLPIISGNVPSSPSAQRSLIPSARPPTISTPPVSHQSRLPSPRSPVISSHPTHLPSSLPPSSHPSHASSSHHPHSSHPSNVPPSHPPSSHSSPVPSSPSSHIPLRSPTLPSSPQRSRLPSLNSSAVSTPPSQHSPLTSPKSQHSPTLPAPPLDSPKFQHSPGLPAHSLESPKSQHLPSLPSPDSPKPCAPLHLMLYHPEEFQVPPAAVGQKPEVCLPQVYVNSDTVTEEKAVIRKAGAGGRVGDCQQGGDRREIGQGWSSVPSPDPSVGSQGMCVGKADQDSMEVDNLCNRLVDELHSVGSLPPSSLTEDSAAGRGSRGSVQVEAVVERRVEDTGVGGEAVVEERLLRVESFGEVQDEEMENALNTGKELLLSHASALASAHPAPMPAPNPTPVPVSSPSPAQPQSRLTHERRPSASKIPRFHKRSDSREEKAFVCEEDAASNSSLQRRTNSQEDNAASDVGTTEGTQSPRFQKHCSSREEKTVVSEVTKVSQFSRYHRQTNSREEKTVVSESGGQAPRLHRRTHSQEDKSVVSCDSKVDVPPPARLHRRANSRDDKNVTSDVSLENTPPPARNAQNRSRVVERNRVGTNTKSKDSSDQGKGGSARTSKIPLCQKIPSPTSSGREPKLSKVVTSPSSPRPPPSKSSQSKAQPSPLPRTRTSLPKSDTVPPPSEEVMEVARPSVKKRAPVSQKGERKGGVGAKDCKSEKGVTVQEVKVDKGEAKLVIEKQPNLKKKIQTVHARKVPHPARQMAEALDTDTCDSSPADQGSTGPSDMDHSGLSSQEDEVFSDENLCLKVGRDRSYSSGMGADSPRSPRQPPFLSPLLNHKCEHYHQMAASRSSLDDSALQLAAERQDDLMLSLEGPGYCTGSLRTRRSQKMRSLVEMFEGGASCGSSEESGDTRRKGRSDSTSGSTTLSAGSQDKGLDPDDDMFHPACSPLTLPSTPPRRSRSRDRGGGGGRLTSPHKQPSQSPSRRMPASRGEEVLRRRRPSPLNNRHSTEEKSRGSTRSESGVGMGRPPRYRSASRGRTYSDSSTSESDNTQLDSNRTILDMLTRPRAGPRPPTSRQDDVTSRVCKSEGGGSESVGMGRESVGEQEEDGSQRRGSIKELRQLFEKSPKDENKDSGSELSPPVPPRRCVRTRSVSPAADSSSPLVTPNMMRRSMEIPPSSAMIKQPLRLGPKPFYGSKK